MIITHIKAAIRRHDLFRPGQHVLVGVSGGADSIACLAILRELTPAWKLRLTAAHLNHRIRGGAADKDARFVRAFARRLRVGYIEGRADVPRLARRRGISLEMAGREARYAFFADAARQRHCDAVATAHTADDQAETILLKLARGTGPQGLSGIPYVTRRGTLKITRPLRDITRADLLQFLRRQHLTWRDDATNTDSAFLRNRVRHEVLPFLEAKLNPRIRQALRRTADILEKENEWLDILAKGLLSKCVGKTDATERVPPWAQQTLDHRKGGPRSVVAVRKIPRKMPAMTLNGRILASHPPAARRRVLRLWLVGGGLAPELLDFDAVNRLDRLLMARQSGRAVTLPGGWIARKQGPDLYLDNGKPAPVNGFRVPLNIPGVTRVPKLGLRITASLSPGIHREKPPGIGHFPVRASLALPAWRQRRVIARSWQPGDRIRPLGLAGSKKIQDIFVDGKVPREMRSHIPLLECGEKIIWVPGYRIAQGWEVNTPAAASLQVTMERI